MLKNIPSPPCFSLVKKGKVFLLLRKEYEDFLLQEGIDDLRTFLEKNRQTTRYLSGRKPHPSITIKNGKKMIVRSYSHGGLLRAFNRSLYLFGMRSFEELALTEEVRSSGIPTIEPIAAIHRLIFPPLYQAWFLSLEIPQARDLIRYFRDIGNSPSPENLILKRRAIRACGVLLQNFHRAGFFHGDLQLKNILMSADGPRLIDFDRSFRKPILSIRERMKNLTRLNRSAEKWSRLGLPITRTDRFRFFLTYSGDDAKIREAMRKCLRTYPLRSFLYRFSWTLEKIVGRCDFGVRRKTNLP